ncbi:MAG: SAM-dependent methyltransferase [Rhodospirillaceae bacterium]|nr:SAM-dependent methyltransferase [Rhodospirillaceae bacterium]
MNSLEKILIDQIGDNGPLSIAEYMGLALGHPEYGYYRRGDPFGVDGDFITAPEISQMFGEIIGLWAAVMWQVAGSPKSFNLVELGPGRGTLMADMLRASAMMEGFGDAVSVHMVETSPAMRTLQEQSLKDSPLTRAAQWHDSLDSVPDGPLIVIGNEFLDALPIEQYFRAGDYWCPRVVDVKPDGDGLCFVLLPPFDQVDLPPGLADAKPDSMIEFCPAGLDLATDISRRIAGHGGAALFIDYGHSKSGSSETLQAVKAHEFHDPLTDPGEADLTAHVDFGALAQRVFASGARAHGPVTQGKFLEDLGIFERADMLLESATEEQAEDIKGALKRLTGGHEMGALFKVLAITSLESVVPPGFE